MKRLFLVFAILGCVDMPTAFIDHIELRTGSEEVVYVSCTPSIFTISEGTTGTCNAYNADSTIVNITTPIWTSSLPSSLLVNTVGELEVGTVAVPSVTITAVGPSGSFGTEILSVVP